MLSADAADAIFAAGSVILAASAWQIVAKGPKPPQKAALQTAFTLWVFTATYAGIGLYLASAVTAVTASAWSVLCYNRDSA